MLGSIRNNKLLFSLIVLAVVLTVGFIIFFWLTKGTKPTSAASGSETITSQEDWEKGTIDGGIDLDSIPGSVLLYGEEAMISGGEWSCDKDCSDVPLTHDHDIGSFGLIGTNQPLPYIPTFISHAFSERNITRVKLWLVRTFAPPMGAEYNLEYWDGDSWEVFFNHTIDPPQYSWDIQDLEVNLTTNAIRIKCSVDHDLIEVHEMEVYSNATHTSAATQLDGGADFTAWTTFVPNATIPANTSINFRFRTSNDHSTWTDWSASTPYAASIDISGLDQRRYLQVETTLANTDGASTPTLSDYTANYTYDDTCTNFDHITMTPNTTNLTVGGTTTFSTTAYDTLSNPMIGVTFNYNATGGTIDGSGNYTAPAVVGSYSVSVTSSCGGSDSSTITVTEEPAPEPEPTPEPDHPTPENCQEGISACIDEAFQFYQNCFFNTQNDTEKINLCQANYCADTNSCLTACNLTGADQFSTLKIISPEKDQIYHLSETIPVKWFYINGNSEKWDGSYHLYDPAYVEMYLSTNGGESYKHIKTLFNNKRNAWLSYYKSKNPSIATDFYYNYPDQDKSYLISEDLNGQNAYHYYNFTLPVSRSIVSNNIKIKLVPIQTCDATQPGESESFKIQELPNRINLYVNPSSQSIKKGQYGSFSAKAYNQYGQDITSTTSFNISLTDEGSQGGTLIDLGGGNFRVIGIKNGVYLSGAYIRAENNGISAFNYASFAVYEGTLSLDYITIEPGDIQFKRGESAYYKARPVDQYGMALLQADINWKILDSRAGTIKQGSTDEIGIFTASNNQGCYPYIVEATASYGGKTYKAYSSLSIGREDYIEDPNTDGKEGISADQNIEPKSLAISPGTIVTQAGRHMGFYGYFFDSRNRPYAASDTNSLVSYLPGLSMSVKTYNAALFDVSFDGANGYIKPKINTPAGTYENAVTIQSSYKGITFEASAKVVVLNSNPKYGFSTIIPFGSYYGNAKYYTNLNTAIKTYYSFEMPKNGVLATWLGVFSEEGYFYSFGQLSVSMKLSDQFTNLAGLRTRLYFRAPNTIGLYKKAVTYTVKAEGKTYTYDIDIDVKDNAELLSKCYITPCDGCDPCDPKDPGCCDPKSQNCDVCLNPPCGDYDSGGENPICQLFGGDNCPKIIKSIGDDGSTTVALLAVLAFAIPMVSSFVNGLTQGSTLKTALRNSFSKLSSAVPSIATGSQAAGGTGSSLIRSVYGYKSKTTRPWGVVFDKYSKKPISGVKVYLFSWPDHKLIDTQVTNDVGEFAFLSSAGQYYFKVEKYGFYITELVNKNNTRMITASSQLLSKFKPFKPRRSDGYYSNIYLIPEVITQKGDAKNPLEVAIPMIPANVKPTGFARFWSKFMYILDIIRLPLLILGSFFVIIDIVWRAAWYDWVILGIYGLLWAVEIYFLVFKPKTWGEIKDKRGKPVDLALIRLMDKRTGRIVSTQVTGRDGRFAFNANTGEYVLKISKEGLKNYYSKPFTIKHLKNMGNLKFVV